LEVNSVHDRSRSLLGRPRWQWALPSRSASQRPFHRRIGSSRTINPVPAWEAEALSAAFYTPLTAVISPLGGLLREVAVFLAFAPQSGFRHYLKMQYADQTFKGLYHWNWFDASMLLPYFAVMIVLSFYGIHRYTMAYQ